MATLPIHLEVEDVAVGPVLIALRKMPGIIKLHLDLLGDAPSASHREPKNERGSAKAGANAERIVALLMQNNGGPLKIGEIMRALGSTKSSAYTAMYTLKKKKVVQSPHAGEYELTDKAKRELLPDHAPKLLTGPKTNGAKPAKTKAAKLHKGPGGRPSPGSGWKMLRAALDGGALKRAELITKLAESGMSEKSVSGIMARADRDKLIKNAGEIGVWELTPKGRSQQPAEAATGV
jgi:hypothetical protein